MGITQSSDFPTTTGAFRRTGAAIGFTDVFVTKLNPTGTALVYSTFIGGSDLDWGRAIALDASGNAFVTGTTGSQDFPTTSGAVDSTYNGGVVDAYVAELSADGSTLLYGTYLGGADSDNANDIALGPAGSVYVTGGVATLTTSTLSGTPSLTAVFQGNGDTLFERDPPTLAFWRDNRARRWPDTAHDRGVRFKRLIRRREFRTDRQFGGLRSRTVALVARRKDIASLRKEQQGYGQTNQK